jgi:hypothetical protein
LRTELAAEASLAAILARNRFGMAIAAMIRMIATTINSSIKENPRFRFIARPFSFLAFSIDSCCTLRANSRPGAVADYQWNIIRINSLQDSQSRFKAFQRDGGLTVGTKRNADRATVPYFVTQETDSSQFGEDPLIASGCL